MNWGNVEKAFVATLKALTRPDGKHYAELCDQYNGEFQGPWSLPEDFNPNKRYALVQFQSGSGSSASKGSQFDMAVSGQMAVLIGSESSDRRFSKQDVYEMLDVFQKALHGATADIDGVLVKILWAEDALEFSEPNHICYRQTYNISITHYRIENGSTG